MFDLSIDQLMAIMTIAHTDNSYIYDELLRIKPDKTTWAEVRRVGKEAEGRILEKSGRSDGTLDKGLNINKVGADDEIRCYRCNGRGHRLFKCKSDKTKMKCSDCGDTAEFRLSPHYKGAKLCPKTGGYKGARPKTSEKG